MPRSCTRSSSSKSEHDRNGVELLGDLLSVCALLLLTGCTARTTLTCPANPSVSAHVWVLETGWHTGIALGRRELGTTLLHLLAIPRTARSVIFGWGDLRWYAKDETGIFPALRALFPSRSTLWVQACRHRPPACVSANTHWQILPLSPRGRHGLDRFLLETLTLTAKGRIVAVAGPLDPWGEFLRARPPYDAFHTCNTWTAEALRHAGFHIQSFGILFAVQLWGELPRCQARESSAKRGGPHAPGDGQGSRP